MLLDSTPAHQRRECFATVFKCSVGGQKNNFSSHFFSSGWAKNQINMRQINRRNDQMYYVCTHVGSLGTWEPRTHGVVGADSHSGLRRGMDAGVWDFKGKVCHSQVDEKEQTFA